MTNDCFTVYNAPYKTFTTIHKSNKTEGIFFPVLYLYISSASVIKPNIYLREKNS